MLVEELLAGRQFDCLSEPQRGLADAAGRGDGRDVLPAEVAPRQPLPAFRLGSAHQLARIDLLDLIALDVDLAADIRECGRIATPLFEPVFDVLARLRRRRSCRLGQTRPQVAVRHDANRGCSVS
jgi:hypothetical protein